MSKNHWRERDRKKEARARMHECPTCAINFGGRGTKVDPGEKCYHCGWEAPGNPARTSAEGGR